MPDELPFVRVAEIFAKGELSALSDVVKDAAGQQEVEVEILVAAGYAPGQLAEGECMFEKSADVGMVKALSRRTMAQREEEIVVPEEGFEQTLQVFVFHRMNDALQLFEHLVFSSLGSREEIFVQDVLWVEPGD